MNKKDLVAKLKQLEGLTPDERAELINLLNTKKKYGLVWEDKPEDAEELLRTHLPVLREVEERRILSESGFIELKNEQNKTVAPQQTELFDTEEDTVNIDTASSSSPSGSSGGVPNHILIEGDNLHALTALTFTHEGKVDVIYIDPPYNTGNNDFIYHDAFKDEAEFIGKEHPFRHSTWLSFMSKRLELSKKLLCDEGVIFISIDENECYQLKLLCDEIFGSDNFIADNVWKSKSGGAGDASFIAIDTENILMYAKNKNTLNIQNDDEATVTTSYNRLEEDGRKYSLDRLDKQSLGYQESLDFPIIGPDNQVYLVEHRDPENKVARWRWGKDTVKDRYEELVFENGYVYTKNYEKESNKPRNLLIEERFGRTRTGKTELFAIIGANNFSSPKPSRLISYLIKLYPKTDATILDFFAGSGTTLHAVMQLNELDNGNRKCIICTNNEQKICDNITYPRIYNIINGYNSKGNTQVELYSQKINLTVFKKADLVLKKINLIKETNKDNFNKIKIEIKDNSINVWGETKKGNFIKGLTNNNLRYYRTEFVGSTKTEQNKRLLTQASTDLLCIKEDCYTDITSENGFDSSLCKLFTNERGKYLVVVFHSRKELAIIELLVKLIKSLTDISEKIRLYAFSPEKETLVADFWEVANIIEAVPLPEAIYNAYRATFRTIKLNRKPAQITDESMNEQTIEE